MPIQEFSGIAGAQNRNPADPELRLDFLTALSRTGSIAVLKDLGLALQPQKFTEFSLIRTTLALLLSRAGACMVNIPAPEHYAVHKLIVYGERPVAQRVKAVKDLEQAAALAQWHLANGLAGRFNETWRDAMERGKGWKKRGMEGRRALLRKHPELASRELWGV